MRQGVKLDNEERKRLLNESMRRALTSAYMAGARAALGEIAAEVPETLNAESYDKEARAAIASEVLRIKGTEWVDDWCRTFLK